MNPAAATALSIIGPFIASVALTGMLRSLLMRRSIVAPPNDRSLHEESTVTGGGFAVAVVLIVMWVVLWGAGVNPDPALLIPVLVLSATGLADDVRNLAWVQKLFLQAVAAVLFILAFGPFTRLELFGLVVDNTSLTTAFSILWLVAFVNIYNFMDGIDGLAGGYGALCACVLGVWFVLAGDISLSLFMYALMAGCLGFLVWNWAPAKIFLGDAGSMMLGGTLAAMGIIGQRVHDIPLSAFVLLYAVFIGDTVYTLVRRAARGERVWQAHREHLYQRAVQSGLTHSSVTGRVLLLSVIICIFASFEMGRVGPRFLWPLLSLTVLCIAMISVKQREKRIP